MQVSKGVEWSVHAMALMCALPVGSGLRASALATYHGVPAAYMAKQLQMLSKAGLVTSSRGAKGGYRLAKAPIDINLWDITAAIEGMGPAFRCTEIRQNGPCGLTARQCDKPCSVARAFLAAETAYRAALAQVSLEDIAMGVAADASPGHMLDIMNWIGSEVST